MSQRLRRAPRPAHRNVQGFVLLEALVAILLFVTGILGIIGLQTSLTRSQTESAIRSEAAYLAHELVGLMWANIASLDGFGVSSGECSAAACKLWLAKTKATLPNGNAVVTLNALTDGSTGSNVDVTVTWTMPGGEARKYMTRSTLVTTHTP